MYIYVTLVGESGSKENPLHVVMQPRQRMCMCMCMCTCMCISIVFYGPYGHPYDCFPMGSNYMHVYIYIFLCHLHEYAMYM